MKKLQITALIALFLEVLLWTTGRTLFPLPDWIVRLNGVMMLITLPLLAFVSVRVLKESLNKSPAAAGGSFSPQMRCSFLKYTKYSCETAPFCGEKSLATRSCRFNQSFLKKT